MIERIIEILCEVIANPEISETIDEQSDLVNGIGLDSLQMINFVLQIEDEFDIEIDFDEFDIELLYNLGRFVSYLEICRRV